MLGGEVLDALDVLLQERGDEVSAVGEIAIERRLPDARPTSDLIHRDVASLGEQLSRGTKDRLAIALSVLALRGPDS